MIGGSRTHEVNIREVRAADAQRWINLRHRLWPDQTVEDLSEDVHEFFNRGTPLVVVAFLAWCKNQPIGFLELSVRPYVPGAASQPAPFVEGWFVNAEWRRRGVGRMLVKAAEDWASSRGHRQLGSDADVENMVGAAAHEAMGFREVETIRCFIKDLDGSRQRQIK